MFRVTVIQRLVKKSGCLKMRIRRRIGKKEVAHGKLEHGVGR